MPACCRNAEMPSGRRKGPEKSRSTVREACAGLAASKHPTSERSPEGGAAAARVGIPGGWSRPVSPGADAT
eukprot:4089528-Pleurochrysis_carterae.AAC.1